MNNRLIIRILKQSLRFFVVQTILVIIFDIIIQEFSFRNIGYLFNGMLLSSIVGGTIITFYNKLISISVKHKTGLMNFEKQLLNNLLKNKYEIIIRKNKKDISLRLKNKFIRLLVMNEDLIKLKFEDETILITGSKFIVNKLSNQINNMD